MKYLAKIVNYANRDVFFFRVKSPGGAWNWTKNQAEAHRFDTKDLALDSLASFPKENYQHVIIADVEKVDPPEDDKFYAAARSKQNGRLFFNKLRPWGYSLHSHQPGAAEFPSRFDASRSLRLFRKDVYDFKVGTLDEIQKWYDQFGKSEAGDRVEGFQAGTVTLDEVTNLRGPLATLTINPQGIVAHHTVEHPVDVPEQVTRRREVEQAVSAELNWDIEKLGTIVGFLGELPTDMLEGEFTAGSLYDILYNLYEELGGEDE